MVLREQAGPLTEKQRKMLEEAERSCARLGALVTEMSDLGKLESGDLALARQDFDVGGLVTEVASGMHEGVDRGVRLDVRGADRPAMVTGDRARLSAALGALFHSALRERGEPGVVVAECLTMETAGTNWAVVAIGDAAILPALVEAHRAPPGFDEWRGGLGLALPVARRVIEAHGGVLWSADGSQSRAAAALRLPLRV
jgi:signal transduction histidine kinase